MHAEAWEGTGKSKQRPTLNLRTTAEEKLKASMGPPRGVRHPPKAEHESPSRGRAQNKVIQLPSSGPASVIYALGPNDTRILTEELKEPRNTELLGSRVESA